MITNEEIQSAVQESIKWESILHAAEIGVTVRDGIVTLSGTVNSLAKKHAAENAAKNVSGVKAVVERIDVHSAGWGAINDTDIAREILNAFKWNLDFPEDKIKVRVENGWVTLEGELKYHYQIESAKRAVIYLNGVKGLSDMLVVKTETKDLIEKGDIENALKRNWAIVDHDIHVSVNNDKVTLKGIVNSLYQKNEAGRLAESAPGVSLVDNEIVVEHFLTA